MRGSDSQGHRGPKKPPMEEVSQEVVNNEDGSISITISGTDPEGEVRSNTVTVSDNGEGGIDIASLNDQGRSKTVAVSEDAEDGGVDLDIVCINEEGETVTKHVELDMNDDGTISFEALITRDGEEFTVEKELELARFLGEEDEELNVIEVVEAYLERGPIDMTEVDLTGLNNQATDVDLLVV